MNKNVQNAPEITSNTKRSESDCMVDDVDASINTPWTRTRIKKQIGQPEEFFAQPEDIAEEIFHIAKQNRSAWSFDYEIRPDIEEW